MFSNRTKFSIAFLDNSYLACHVVMTDSLSILYVEMCFRFWMLQSRKFKLFVNNVTYLGIFCSINYLTFPSLWNNLGKSYLIVVTISVSKYLMGNEAPFSLKFNKMKFFKGLWQWFFQIVIFLFLVSRCFLKL